MNRSDVYQIIDGERAYQQAQEYPKERSLYDWIGSIRHYNNKALHADIKGKDNVNTLHNIRKIAAFAIAALEQYGCVPREGYESAMPKADWSQAPEWAMWWAVDCDGRSYYHIDEPVVGPVGYVWLSSGQSPWPSSDIDIPLGIDWRLLKQHRPEPTL